MASRRVATSGSLPYASRNCLTIAGSARSFSTASSALDAMTLGLRNVCLTSSSSTRNFPSQLKRKFRVLEEEVKHTKLPFPVETEAQAHVENGRSIERNWLSLRGQVMGIAAQYSDRFQREPELPFQLGREV